MEQKDVIIIGGGPAGLAAAVELCRRGVRDILILEREETAGGILKQCIHDGFGLTRFHTTLSGPEYAQRFLDETEKENIQILTGTSVLSLTPDRVVTAVGRGGLKHFKAKAVVLAMGCRERTRGALAIPGERPAGVFTAGVAQSYINLHNRMVGKRAVILGSGDIGMIMARRLTLEGAEVSAVFEIQPYPSGLPRNIHQCLEDYGIPLYLSHTVTDIHGKARLTGVTVSQVDEKLKPVPGTEQDFSCDTLILSVGLIPENELSMQAGVQIDPRTKGAVVDEFCRTSVEGIFAAGNVLHVHDLVDFVSLEAERLADSVAEYVKSGSLPENRLSISADKNINHTVPQKISGKNGFTLSLRVSRPLAGCEIQVLQNGKVIQSKKMKKAIPAEMIQIPVSRESLSGNGNLEVRALC
ncbi:FAD-dependent oxidoreductase [Caproiciproducens sp. NJN-50]|uniref:NAD(P)/FAD-dependent oxidoreductase n=1 Tax=Acutalibacteraceae TaxID=3082771 RepID=UPI000FFE2FFE|nr:MULTISPECIES: NAD(P)/FAD-dependent oxidoreductase [Acutalibacteraceae]QAT50979.1 FAD-dependent oxidoreductase [Caproiciproducens sp. NJN-50]